MYFTLSPTVTFTRSTNEKNIKTAAISLKKNVKKWQCYAPPPHA